MLQYSICSIFFVEFIKHLISRLFLTRKEIEFSIEADQIFGLVVRKPESFSVLVQPGQDWFLKTFCWLKLLNSIVEIS